MPSIRFLGKVDCAENHGEYEIDSPLTVLPRRIKFTFFECDPNRRAAWTLLSARFDFKARESPVDLESRESWAPTYLNHYMGEVQVVESLDVQGLYVDVEITLSWDSCYVMLRWRGGAVLLSSHPAESTVPKLD